MRRPGGRSSVSSGEPAGRRSAPTFRNFRSGVTIWSMRLDRGAVALLDALGVKESWKGPDGSHDTSAMTTLKAMKHVVEKMRDYCDKALIPRVLESEFGEYGRPKVETAVFSDTIAVTATMPSVDVDEDVRGRLDALLVDIACQCAGYVLRKGPQQPRPLVYRGVVTCADVLVELPFFLGPAIDDAAANYEQADGAFVWLAHSALEAARHHRPYHPDVWKTMVIPYAVPLKAREVQTIALTTFTDTVDSEEIAQIRTGIERAMEKRGDPAVARKRENTLRFIDHSINVLRSTGS